MFRRNVKQSFLKCSSCGNMQTIFRRSKRLREKGHAKHLWCYRCQAVTKHIEYQQEWGFSIDADSAWNGESKRFLSV